MPFFPRSLPFLVPEEEMQPGGMYCDAGTLQSGDSHCDAGTSQPGDSCCDTGNYQRFFRYFAASIP